VHSGAEHAQFRARLINIPCTKRAHSRFATGNSDLLATLAAFEACLDVPRSSLKSFCQDNFISPSAFRDILSLRQEYMGALSQAGLVPPTHLRWGEDKAAAAKSLDANSSNENLIKAIVFAGTGHLAKAKLPEARFDEVSGGTVKREHEAREVKIFEREGERFPLGWRRFTKPLFPPRSSVCPPELATIRRAQFQVSLLDLFLEIRHVETVFARCDRGE
jgi:hypothetical protein